MFGEPEDVEGECNALLYLADNFGDNHTTIRCQLMNGHEGSHEERCRNDTVLIQWGHGQREIKTLQRVFHILGYAMKSKLQKFLALHISLEMEAEIVAEADKEERTKASMVRKILADYFAAKN